VDTTEADSLRQDYEQTRPVIAIIQVDNYDELMKSCADTQRSAVLAQIDEKLNQWAEGAGLLLKTERDHYLFIFEEQHFEHFVADKFSVLDAIRDIRVAEGVHPTLSIGLGKDADGMSGLYKNATLSLEMALSRGGDQAVVRSRLDFAFYGGRAKTAEKRTKVKSRVMANALAELMADAEQIYIMGHSYADMDSVGAAAGLLCIARKRGARRRSSSTGTTTPPGRCWSSSAACRSTPGLSCPETRRFCACAARRAADRGGHQPPRFRGIPPGAGILQPRGGHRPPPPGRQLYRKRGPEFPRALRLQHLGAGDGAAAVPGGAHGPAA
jgi:hypothetical protein